MSIQHTGRSKNKKFQTFALKVVRVTYERWFLTRGSKYSYSTWKLRVFWEISHRGEVHVVANGGLTVFKKLQSCRVYHLYWDKLEKSYCKSVLQKLYLFSHSSLNTPPRAFALIPGGNTQGIGWPPCLASDASLAKPWNFPLSFTEKIRMTFLYRWKQIQNLKSY